MWTAETLTDDAIESLLDDAIDREDIELVDLCETALKTIVQPNLKHSARVEIARVLNARADNYDGPPDGEAWSGGFAENH